MTVCSLSRSLACAAGATGHLLWTNEARGGAGRALVTGTGWTAPAPVRNTQALHKHTHTHILPYLVFPSAPGGNGEGITEGRTEEETGLYLIRLPKHMMS